MVNSQSQSMPLATTSSTFTRRQNPIGIMANKTRRSGKSCGSSPQCQPSTGLKIVHTEHVGLRMFWGIGTLVALLLFLTPLRLGNSLVQILGWAKVSSNQITAHRLTLVKLVGCNARHTCFPKSQAFPRLIFNLLPLPRGSFWTVPLGEEPLLPLTNCYTIILLFQR